jgi:Zn-dependent peptidase ImmA (M78 family)
MVWQTDHLRTTTGAEAAMGWTNKSVLRLAGGADPIKAIETRAKDLILKAKDAGWSGPPYNPARIADILGVPVQANGGIADARTVPTDRGVIIEYNPTHARERVRFSLAHELAHLLFDDHADQIRNRHKNYTGDEWQLELLCNIAASEFVMPVGSFPDPETIPDIEELMVNRRELDVSAEAYLIRFAKASKVPVMMFRASPIGEALGDRAYRIDYTVTDQSTDVFEEGRLKIPADSRIKDCSAIGLTAKFEETWFRDMTVSIQAVGIPNSPGSAYPRVAGLIRLPERAGDEPAIKYVHGDLRYLTGERPRILCQLVNNTAKTWGGGLARQIAQKYPIAQAQFKDWISAIPFPERLGKVHISQPVSILLIASIVGQEGFGPSEHPRIRYSALRSGLERVAEVALERDAAVHMPRIGLGAAGAEWSVVEDIINDTLVARQVDVTIHDLPPRRDPELSLFD